MHHAAQRIDDGRVSDSWRRIGVAICLRSGSLKVEGGRALLPVDCDLHSIPEILTIITAMAEHMPLEYEWLMDSIIGLLLGHGTSR